MWVVFPISYTGEGVDHPLFMKSEFHSFSKGAIYMNKRKLTNRINIFLFLLPALILFVSIVIVPIFVAGYGSLYADKLPKFNDDVVGTLPGKIEQPTSDGKTMLVDDPDQPLEGKFGLYNYWALLGGNHDKNGNYVPYTNFLDALKNTMVLAILSVFIQLPMALALALVLGKGIKGERLFMSVFFMPVLISAVIIGQLFKKIYNAEGLLNTILYALNLDALARPNGDWAASSSNTMIGAIFTPTLWQYVGYHMLLMYAGVKSVPMDIREAARIDGATDGQVNRFIVIPYIKPIIKICVIFSVTGSLKSYDMFAVLGNINDTKGQVPATLLVKWMTTGVGKAYAVSIMMVLLCFLFALIINAIFRQED